MSHVDLDQVADLDGGVLNPEQERAVRGHLETCDECAQLLERVREVHDLLTAEPAPPLPAAMATRLDDSLAAAVRDREARTRVVSLERARARRNTLASRLLAAAVGLAVVGGGAYVAQNVLGTNTSNQTSSDSVAGRNPEAGAAGKAGLAVPSNLRFQSNALKSQLKTAVTDKKGVFDSLQGGSPAVPTSLERIAPNCVSSALGSQMPAKWTSYRVRFDSRPAVLVLSPAGIARVRAWVVECAPTPTVSASTSIPTP